MDQLKYWLSTALKPCDYFNVSSQSGQKVIQALHNDWFEKYGRYFVDNLETKDFKCEIFPAASNTKEDVFPDTIRQSIQTFSIQESQSSNSCVKSQQNLTHFDNEIFCAGKNNLTTNFGLPSYTSERFTEHSPNFNTHFQKTADISNNTSDMIDSFQTFRQEYDFNCRSISLDKPFHNDECIHSDSMDFIHDKQIHIETSATPFEKYVCPSNNNIFSSSYLDVLVRADEESNRDKKTSIFYGRSGFNPTSFQNCIDINKSIDDSKILNKVTNTNILREGTNTAEAICQSRVKIRKVSSEKSLSNEKLTILEDKQNISDINEGTVAIGTVSIAELEDFDNLMAESDFFFSGNTEILLGEESMSNNDLMAGVCELNSQTEDNSLSDNNLDELKHISNNLINCEAFELISSNENYTTDNSGTEDCLGRNVLQCMLETSEIMCSGSNLQKLKQEQKDKKSIELQHIRDLENLKIPGSHIRMERHHIKSPKNEFNIKKGKGNKTQLIHSNMLPNKTIYDSIKCENVRRKPKGKSKLIQSVISFDKCNKNGLNQMTFAKKKHSSNGSKKNNTLPFKNKLNEIKLCVNDDSNCTNFKIHILDDCSISTMNEMINSGNLLEVGLVIVYKEGGCQLNKPPDRPKQPRYSPDGMMVSLTTTDNTSQYFFISFDNTYWGDMSLPKGIFIGILKNKFRKICFKAHEILIQLIKTFDFKVNEIHHKSALLDSMVASWLLDPDKPLYNFNGIKAKLGINSDGSILKDTYASTCQLLQQLSHVMELLYNKLYMNGLWKLFIDIEIQLIPILATMETRGICVNQKRLEEMGIKLENRLIVLQESAYRAAGKCFQLNSPLQLRQILYSELKLDQKHNIKIKETSTIGVKSTSESMLHLLEHLHPLPSIILEYRHLQKIKSTYIDAIMQHINDGYIFTTWEQISAATGRITSSNPNLQAIPKQGISLPTHTPDNPLLLRSPYQPRPGYTFLAADFQHIELRIYAHLAQDSSLLRILQEPGDIFMMLAQLWLGKPGQMVGIEDREKTKRIVYSVMYGAGPGKVAEFLKINHDEASHIINSFIAQFPTLRSFSNCLLSRCRTKGCLYTISGRCRLFPNICSKNTMVRAHTERQAINFVIQGSAADVCKAYMLQTQSLLTSHPEVNAHLLLQIHDELLWEVRETHMETFKGMIENVMADTNNLNKYIGMFTIPLPVSITTGKNWGEMRN